MLAVEVKTVAGLFTNDPDNHKLLVPSIKCFIGAAILPNRVGLPSAKPAQFFRSSNVTYGAPLSGTLGSGVLIVVSTGGTVRICASISFTDYTPRAICCAISFTAP